MADVTDSKVFDELQTLHGDLLYTERTHFAAASANRLLHNALGGVSTVGSTLAGATIIAGHHPLVAGTSALIAAVTSAVLTFRKPDDLAQKHLAAGRDLGALRVKVRQTRDLGLPAGADVHRVLADLAAEKAVVDRAAPSTTEAAYRRAVRKIGAE